MVARYIISPRFSRVAWRCVAGAALWASASAAPPPPVLLPADDHLSVSLSPYLSLLRDPTGTIGPEKAMDPSLADAFQPNTAERIHFGFTSDAVWTRYTLTSTAPVAREWILELAHTRFELIDWYVVRKGHITEHFKMGNLRALDPEAIHSRCPTIEIDLEPGETVQLYMWLRTSAIFRIPMTLYSPAEFSGRKDVSSAVYFFCFGAFAVLILIGVAFVLYTKGKGQLPFVFGVTLSGITFMCLSGYWKYFGWPGGVFMTTNGLILANELGSLALMTYMRQFFDLRDNMPRLDRILRWATVFGLAFAAWIPFGPFFPLVQLVEIQILLIGAISIYIAIHARLRGDRSARFYIAAWGAFWTMMIAEILQQWHVLPPPTITDLPIAISSVVGYVLFLLSLTDRIHQMRVDKEAAQAQAMHLKNNMTLQLEQQVAERTEKLLEAKQAAERAAQSKSLFLANMSHEIRTPLSALVGLSQAMYRQSKLQHLPADFVHFLDQIRSGGRYLNLMLTNLLDMSASEADKAIVHWQLVELDDWSSSLRNIVEPISSAKGVHLRWEDDVLRGAVIRSDPIRLTHIAINLLHNAVKFTPEGKTVSVRFELSADRFAFEVSDEGPGLPEDQQILFDAFEQSRTPVSGVDRGVGLGLYIVQTNVRMLKGKVEAARQPSGGARFTVEFNLPSEGESDASRID